MTILCLTGWQQPAEALRDFIPQAMHFDYSVFDDADKMFASLPAAPALAVGWSLGGQLLVRAIAGGFIRPRALLLLAAPFQWVEGPGIAQGVSAETASGVREQYQKDPRPMLRNLNGLIGLGDEKEKSVIKALNAHLQLWEKGLYWLDQLARTSCAELDFSGFPPTILVHGCKDKVIYPLNAEAYAAKMPQVKMHLWQECAHAPHLHDADRLRALVGAYV